MSKKWSPEWHREGGSGATYHTTTKAHVGVTNGGVPWHNRAARLIAGTVTVGTDRYACAERLHDVNNSTEFVTWSIGQRARCRLLTPPTFLLGMYTPSHRSIAPTAGHLDQMENHCSGDFLGAALIRGKG